MWKIIPKEAVKDSFMERYINSQWKIILLGAKNKRKNTEQNLCRAMPLSHPLLVVFSFTLQFLLTDTLQNCQTSCTTLAQSEERSKSSRDLFRGGSSAKPSSLRSVPTPGPLAQLVIHLFIVQIFIEHLLYSKHCGMQRYKI